MSDLLKKGFYLGLGAALSGKEKLEKMLDELVSKNELTREEAKNMMQNFVEKGESKKDEWNDKQKEQRKKTAEELGLATKEDVQALQKRIAQLEAKIDDYQLND